MSDRQSIIAEKTKLEKELEALETVINMFGIDITKDISSFGEKTLSPQEQRDYQLISHYNEKKNEIETLEKQLASEPEWLKKEIQAQTDMQREVQIKAAEQAPNPTVREILLAADPATNAKYNALRRILREEEEELENEKLFGSKYHQEKINEMKKAAASGRVPQGMPLRLLTMHHMPMNVMVSTYVTLAMTHRLSACGHVSKRYLSGYRINDLYNWKLLNGSTA